MWPHLWKVLRPILHRRPLPSRHWSIFSLFHEIPFRFDRNIKCRISFSFLTASAKSLTACSNSWSSQHRLLITKGTSVVDAALNTSLSHKAERKRHSIPSTQHWLLAPTAPLFEAAYKGSRILSLSGKREKGKQRNISSHHLTSPGFHFSFTAMHSSFPSFDSLFSVQPFSFLFFGLKCT